MLKPDFAKYLDYAELTASLNELAESNPDLVKMYSIGKTYEGRDSGWSRLQTGKRGVRTRSQACI